MDYFIDESGQTGDIAKLKTLSDFNEQPIFCLAAVGVANEFHARLLTEHLLCQLQLTCKHDKRTPAFNLPEPATGLRQEAHRQHIRIVRSGSAHRDRRRGSTLSTHRGNHKNSINTYQYGF